MAPYLGPSLVALVSLLKKKESVALGYGLPRAPIDFREGMFEIRTLSGGEGFGVQADLVNPFVDEGALFRAPTWQEVIAWLCEHWDPDLYGDAFRDEEKLRITFAGDLHALGIALRKEIDIGLSDAMTTAKEGVIAKKLETARGACRAARMAKCSVDFA